MGQTKPQTIKYGTLHSPFFFVAALAARYAKRIWDPGSNEAVTHRAVMLRKNYHDGGVAFRTFCPGRVWLYDHVGHERVWLPNDPAPNEFQEDYGCEWSYRITQYDRATSTLRLFVNLPEHAMHTLSIIMEEANSGQLIRCVT